MVPTTPRSKALSTRLLLLLEIHNERHAKLKTLAGRLDVTVQAVSDYLKRLTNEGLVENVAGVWKPTKRGTALLHRTMRDLRDFVEDSMGRLRTVEDTFALADRRLGADEEVGLYLQAGRLHAGRTRGAESRGRTRTAAGPGQLVLVGDLKGILKLRPASVTFLGHPDFPTGPALDRARKEILRRPGGRPRLVAVHGVPSIAWARALGLEPSLEFAPLAATQDAAQRGVPVLYLVPVEELAGCVSQLREATRAASEAIPVRSVEL